MNLLIRAIHSKNLSLTRPRNINPEEWTIQIDNRLSKACNWIISQRKSDGLWGLDDRV